MEYDRKKENGSREASHTENAVVVLVYSFVLEGVGLLSGLVDWRGFLVGWMMGSSISRSTSLAPSFPIPAALSTEHRCSPLKKA